MDANAFIRSVQAIGWLLVLGCSNPAAPITTEELYPELMSAFPAVWQKHLGTECNPIGIPVVPQPAPALGKLCHSPTAKACAYPTQILVREDLAGYELRSVLVHELAHICAGPLSYTHEDLRVWGHTGFGGFVGALIVEVPGF